MIETILACMILTGPEPVPGKIRISIALDNGTNSRSLRLQWNRRSKWGAKYDAWRDHFREDLSYIEAHATVELLDEHYPVGVAEYPSYRIGYGKWQRFRHASFCPCGHFIPSLRYVVEDWHYTSTAEYIEYLGRLYRWRAQKKQIVLLTHRPILTEEPKPPPRPRAPFKARY